MKGKTYIISTRDFTYINFSIFPEMAIYFQRKYASPKTTTTISEKKCITLSPAKVFTFLVSGSLILTFNRRSPICCPFNKNKTLKENHYEVCSILITEIFRFKLIPEMFSRFQEMNYPKLFADCCQDISVKDVTKVLSEYIKKMSWKTGDRVLDMGCGPGRVTTQVLMPRLPADFGLLVGADKSADMIQIANETYTHPKLSFTQFDLIKDIGDTSQLRSSDFDKIFTFFLLHWVPDNRYYLGINPGFHIFFCVLLNDIFTVLTHTFI